MRHDTKPEPHPFFYFGIIFILIGVVLTIILKEIVIFKKKEVVLSFLISLLTMFLVIFYPLSFNWGAQWPNTEIYVKKVQENGSYKLVIKTPEEIRTPCGEPIYPRLDSNIKENKVDITLFNIDFPFCFGGENYERVQDYEFSLPNIEKNSYTVSVKYYNEKGAKFVIKKVNEKIIIENVQSSEKIKINNY